MLRYFLLITIALQAIYATAQCGTVADVPPYPVSAVHMYERGGSTQFVIPVLVHVYYSDVGQPLTTQQIISAIDAANEDLRGTNADTSDVSSDFSGIIGDLSIELRLASLDENGNCTSGIDYIWYDHTQGFIPDIAVGSQNTTNYLNIHIYPTTNSQSSIPLPGQPAGLVQDCIVFSYWDGANRPRILTHEVGHWVGLYHTFGNTNIGGLTCDDDGVLDTPETAGSIQWSCDTTLNNCVPNVVENVQNHMDYANCPLMFTLGQEARVAAVMLDTAIQRSNHYSASNLVNTGVYVTSTCPIQTDMWHRALPSVCDTTDMEFFSMVSGQVPDQLQWSFPGGIPSTSNAPVPKIAYTSTGNYTAQLIACRQGICDTATITFNVVVLNGGSNGLATVNSLPFTEDFEGGFSFPQAHMVESYTNLSQWQACNFAGYASANSLYVPASAVTISDSATFVIGNFDFSNTVSPTVSFKVAGTDYPLSWYHTIQILYRDVCSNAPQPLYWHVFGQTQMSGANTSVNFIPNNDNQWETMSVSFPQWTSSSLGEVGIRFIRPYAPSPPFQPEALYLDDLYIGEQAISTGVEDVPPVVRDQVFPNPASEQITLRIAGQGSSKMILQDATGRQVMNSILPSGESTLNVASLPRGAYVLVLESAAGRTAHKVLLN